MPSRLPWTDCSLPGCPGTRFLVSSGLFEGGSETVVQLLDGHGWEVVDRLVGALSVVPVDPSQGCCLDVADVAPGPSARISSVLYRPIVVSARAFSEASAAAPTEGSAPACISRSTHAIEV